MSPTDAVTYWIDLLKAGDRVAVQPLLERYFHRVVDVARQRLRAAPRRMADEEDVALSVFDSFCRAVEEGRLPQLTDRDSLWSHLFVYTLRKASNLIEWERTKKRGSGRVVTTSALDGPDGEPGLLESISREPPPELVALFEEQYRVLFDRLPSDEFRSVVQWKLEGHTNDEIATKLGCVRRTVERMLQLIRGLWTDESES